MRDVVHIIQPDRNRAMRKGRLQRRKYYAAGPNHIWHCDGYDKIKPFGFAIHGSIDGWSRKLIWLKVAGTNNDSRVICHYFIEAIRTHGKLPRIVRTDCGTKNVLMANVQTVLRQEHTDQFANVSVMRGPSTHNQRIERFWGYLSIQSYMDLFKDFRDSGVLNMENVMHCRCLRFLLYATYPKRTH